MSAPKIVAVQLTKADENKPLLLVGPGLGTGVEALWQLCANELADDFEVVGYDLPGHGHSPASTEEFSLEELADSAAAIISEQAASGRTVFFAGVSVSGAVALELALKYGEKFTAVAAVCSAAKLGTPEAWQERAELVAKAGTPTMVTGSAQRWFAPGFIEKHPERTTGLLHTLQNADRFAYAHICHGLAGYDVRDRLGEIDIPVLAIGGAVDPVCPPQDIQFISSNVPNGAAIILDDVAHQAPLEKPKKTAAALREVFLGKRGGAAQTEASQDGAAQNGAATLQEVFDSGMKVRREVLSDAHVDRANANKDEFTEEFQDLISKYAWGSIWTRPGLDKRMRSAVTLTAMVAGGYWEELAMHVKAARRNGLSVDEIKEILLQTAIYCSVPAANVAFKVAKDALAEYAAEEE
ncbi:bifunctional 3-oxoadipate enol-lactonase/4-carboxymuconolactone decarboxylase PcaDC [Micrococcoides hystricis]|uniref:bifunctional 3-oxoadipate enol-lactonase/4-carboxymuconolactone decarboxylase PcaDC n=1 Tax=Micrococcoides hystricis TaxID=1572761 RepID=UPI001CEBA69E